ncbi:MAG: glycosyltransferase family 39 protein [Verrucomicrobiota bacterium]
MVTNLSPVLSPLLAVNWLLIGGSLFALLAVVGLLFWLVRFVATTETGVQSMVHAMEEGSWVSKLRFVLLLAGICAVFSIFIFAQFRGLSHAKAMDQAQIAREIARGNGFSTKFIRPAALRQFEMNKGALPGNNIPDTYNAPLNPLVNSIFLRMAKNTWQMSPKDLVYTSDRVIASVSMILFLLSVAVNYIIAKRLFDRRLALLGMGLILVADVFWKFSLSGLPQMLMLFIFSGCTFALVRALEARQEGKKTLGWIALAGALFGLLALTHGLTIWIFAGALIYVAILFRPLGRDALVMLAVFTLIFTPWMVRNYKVCGSPFGLAPYSAIYQIRGTESSIMRSMMLNFADVNPTTFRNKIQNQIVDQMAKLFNFLGKSLIAPVFFLALLHLFKMPVTGIFRWGVLLMWIMAVLGMSVFGVNGDEGELQANDLHVLFIPLMIFYGLAFVLVLWTRLEINVRLVRISFLVLIFLVSGFPLLSALISPPAGRVQWPPYVPPFIAILNVWTSEDEIIASDMPWGVAWYADRKSLWIPNTINDFIALNDYNQLGGRIVGLYLTPVTGNQPFVQGVMNGEYKEWAAFITRNIGALKDFPLRASTPLPLNGECVLYSDRDRWSLKTD